jgi:hypothetical protein
LPAEGFRCCVAIDSRTTPKGRRQTWYSTNEALANACLKADAAGWDAYYATATYRTAGPRKQTNVLALRAFRLDADVGAKGYPDIKAAIAAVWCFGRDVLGATPTLVRSGGGVHAYWVLPAPIGPEIWNARALALKALTLEHGLKLDQTTTADSARILRPPGTRNWKTDPPLPVELICVGEPHDILGGVNGAALPGFPALRLPDGKLPPYPGGQGANFFGTLHGGHDPSYASAIVEQCAQLQCMRDWATKPAVSEPHWYALLGVLAHCEDVGITHQWSAEHPQYNRAQTDAKLAQARTASGPSTCLRLDALNPGPCGLCLHRGKVNSPIQLGRNALAAAPPASLPALPFGFGWSHESKLLAIMDPVPPVVISEHPIYLVRLANTEAAERMTLVFRAKIESRGWREIVINASDAFTRDVFRKTLADQHMVFHEKSFPHFQRFVVASIIDFQKKGAYEVVYDQFGFKPARERHPEAITGFVIGHEIIGRDGLVSPTQLNRDTDLKGRYLAPKGELQKWSAAANRLCQPGMEGITFSLAASFGSALMLFAGDWGGAVIHATNDKSGTGKTFVLNAIASVWGDLMAMRIDDQDSMNSKFINIAKLCNLPVVYEELRERDPIVAQRYVMIHTTGKDRARATATGGIVELENTWCNILFSASNLSLADLLGAGTNQDAPAMRVFEYQNKSTFTNAEATAIGRALTDNRGTAGRAFMSLVMKNLPAIAQMVERRMAHYEQAMSATTEHRFWLRLAGVVDVALRLLGKLDILSVDIDRIMSWYAKQIGVQIKNKVLTAHEDLGAIGAFLAANMRHALVCAHAWVPKAVVQVERMPQNAECHMRLNRLEKRLYVEVTFVREWLLRHQFNFRYLEQALIEKEILLRPRVKLTLTAGTNQVGGQVICWELNSDAVEGLPVLLAADPRHEPAPADPARPRPGLSVVNSPRP